jgi:hypothetical protein
MNLDKDKPKPAKTDPKAPELLKISITNQETGEELYKETVTQKHFSTGSVGYYVGGKMTNPASGERYQISCNIALIGSKPEK